MTGANGGIGWETKMTSPEQVAGLDKCRDAMRWILSKQGGVGIKSDT